MKDYEQRILEFKKIKSETTAQLVSEIKTAAYAHGFFLGVASTMAVTPMFKNNISVNARAGRGMLIGTGIAYVLSKLTN